MDKRVNRRTVAKHAGALAGVVAALGLPHASAAIQATPETTNPPLHEWLRAERAEGEVAAEIDVPFELESDTGDRLSATIMSSGTLMIWRIGPGKEGDLGSLVVHGFAPEEAQAIPKSALGKLWNWLKGVARAVYDALTFSGGPYLGTCGPSADLVVTHVDGREVVTGATVGVGCAQ